jgi:long-chain acyl-CoA synthetase
MAATDIHSIADIIRTYGTSSPDVEMVSLGDDRRTWGDMLSRAGQVANALAAAGVGPGDRVSYIDKNSIEYFEVVFGAGMLDAVVVGVNWRLAPAEMQYIVNDADTKVLVVHQDFAAHLTEMVTLGLTSSPTVVVIGDMDGQQSYGDFVAGHPDTDPGAGQPESPDTVALQLYTSGTTGLPKGAQITNANFEALVAAAESWAMSSDSVSLAAMPMFHIGGSGWSLFGMSNGARTVIMRELDPTGILGLISREGITHAFLVPAVLQFLLMVPNDGADLASMELIAYGASPITEDILVKSMEMFGCDFIQLYGLTETSGAVVQLDPDDHDPGGPRQHLLRAAGKALPGVELKIVDPETGDSLPDGEVGEVWIKSPTNMSGYWKLPEATASSLPGGGWFRSGDAGYLRDGYLYIHDRVKDMIISGGENIYPAEIENVLMSHPGVGDVAVIGVPDDRWGETPKAVVVRAPGTEATESELIEFTRGLLARFKCPSSVDFVDAIPRNPSGKVLKRELRAPYWEGRDRQV